MQKQDRQEVNQSVRIVPVTQVPYRLEGRIHQTVLCGLGREVAPGDLVFGRRTKVVDRNLGGHRRNPAEQSVL